MLSVKDTQKKACNNTQNLLTMHYFLPLVATIVQPMMMAQEVVEEEESNRVVLLVASVVGKRRGSVRV